MYITTPITNAYPPTAGMMLLATIGLGVKLKLNGYDDDVTVCLRA